MTRAVVKKKVFCVARFYNSFVLIPIVSELLSDDERSDNVGLLLVIWPLLCSWQQQPCCCGGWTAWRRWGLWHRAWANCLEGSYPTEQQSASYYWGQI